MFGNECLTRPRMRPGVAQQRTTRILFFIAGSAISAWAPLVPFVKQRLMLTEDVLGLLLLCIGFGSVMTMPLSGVLAARLGCRKVLSTAVVAALILLVTIGVVEDIKLLAVTLFFFGGAIGTVDVVSNVHALIVEKAAGRRLMSGFHGGWSIGGFAGAGLFGLIMNLFGTSPVVTMSVIALFLFVLFLFIARHILPYGADGAGTSIFSLPKGLAVWIGLLCFLLFLAEGSIQDWGAVFLVSMRGMELSSAGIAYMIFSIMMLIGRIGGDKLTQLIGARQAVVGGGIVAGIGFFLIVLTDGKLSLFGFAVVGLGAANIVPVLYSILGRQTVMPLNAAISAVTTMGYMGILLGPALIGFIAHATSIVKSFEMLGALMFLQAIISYWLYQKGHSFNSK